MPRISYSKTASTFSDGAGNVRFTLDLSADLSEYYGRLIRQGQNFKVRSIDVRLKNPNTLAQDDQLSCAGSILYLAPTGNRKKAWRNAFRAVQRLRRMAGLRGKGYDFRVGFHPDYGEVKQQAWVRSESNELALLGADDDQNCVMAVYNSGLQPPAPVDPDLNGFGFPFDTPWTLGTGDMDFKEGFGGDSPYFTQGMASMQADATHFMVAFGGGYDNSGSLNSTTVGAGAVPDTTLGAIDYGFATNAEHITGPFNVMCGLMGVQIDTTIPDDSETQTQDYELMITVDVESWSPL